MASSSSVEIDAALVASLARKSDLAPLATRDEVHQELQDLRIELRAEIREEGERTRRYFDVVTERLGSSIKIIAAGHVHLDAKINGVRNELKSDIAALDRRVTRLEARRR